MLQANGPDGLAVVTVVVVRVVIARVEVEFPSVVRVVRVERTGPVVAVTARVVQIRIVAVTGSREKNKLQLLFRQSPDTDSSEGHTLKVNRWTFSVFSRDRFRSNDGLPLDLSLSLLFRTCFEMISRWAEAGQKAIKAAEIMSHKTIFEKIQNRFLYD